MSFDWAGLTLFKIKKMWSLNWCAIHVIWTNVNYFINTEIYSLNNNTKTNVHHSLVSPGKMIWYQHSAHNLLITRWKGLVSGEESKGCVVDSIAFNAASNSYAVRNLLLQMHRQKEISVSDPPENRQMRFGFYKAAHFFIGM